MPSIPPSKNNEHFALECFLYQFRNALVQVLSSVVLGYQNPGGILEIFGKAYISSQMADAIVFGVLIVVLVVKPTGILGKNIQEKV